MGGKHFNSTQREGVGEGERDRLVLLQVNVDPVGHFSADCETTMQQCVLLLHTVILYPMLQVTSFGKPTRISKSTDHRIVLNYWLKRVILQNKM